MRGASWIPLWSVLILVAMLPLFFGQLFTAALIKLRLEPTTALLVMIGIFLGSPINIPVKRMSREESVLSDPWRCLDYPAGGRASNESAERRSLPSMWAGASFPSRSRSMKRFIWPWQDSRRSSVWRSRSSSTRGCATGWRNLLRESGSRYPDSFPPLLLLVPDQAPPVAFVAGVLGPLIGADLLHLRDIEKIATYIASIGGAGTFDGIVLSGIVAAYLA